MNISEFVRACDAFCEAHQVTRVWLSKRLLSDTYKLEKLANGEVDIGVRRLEQAVADLRSLQQERAAQDAAA